MKVSIVAAIAKNNVIGLDNAMPWYLPEDLRNFRRITIGKPILMGRITFESLGKRLPGRANIVISKQSEGLKSKGCRVFGSIEDALAKYGTSEEIMVIGGESIYRQTLPLTDRMYLTMIEKNYDGDTYFPIFEASEWAEISNQKLIGGEEIPYRNVILDRKSRD